MRNSIRVRAVISLFALFLGAICVLPHSALLYGDERELETSAMDRIERSNGEIEFPSEQSPDGRAIRASTAIHFGPKWRGGDAGIADLKYVRNVRSVDFGESVVQSVQNGRNAVSVARPGITTVVTDAGIRLLYGVATIEELSLENTALTDKGLEGIERLVKLKRLSVRGTKVTDAGILRLQRLRSLVNLDVSRTAIRDNSIASLAALPRLQVLNVAHTAIEETAISSFKQLKSLRELDVSGTKLSEKSVLRLAGTLPNCEVTWDGVRVKGTTKQ